jgi:hypothetical protein
VLLADNFVDAQNGWLPTGPRVNGSVRYLDGEYQIVKTAVGNPWVGADIPGTFTDSSVAIDARFANPTPDVGLTVACRAHATFGYFVRIQPQLRVVALIRFDGADDRRVYLLPDTPQTALQRDSSNHVELRCIGTTISVLLNGTVVTSAQDSTYASGSHRIVAGAMNGGTSDARFSHLVITQQ